MSDALAFTKDFQVNLLIHLVRDQKFYKSVAGRIRIDDFGLPACQLVFEALESYYRQFGSHPKFDTLVTHVQWMLANVDGNTKALIPSELYESLGRVLSMASQSTATDAEYYQAKLTEYLTMVRVSKTNAMYSDQLSQGQGTAEYVDRLIQVKQDLSALSGLELVTPDMDPYILTAPQCGIQTSMGEFNAYTGGLRRTEYGLVTACPGVGKTTALINFCAAAVLNGWRSLMLTLENPRPMIEFRYFAIAAHIPIGEFDTPVVSWTNKQYQWQYARLLDRRYRYRGYWSLVDMSQRNPTLAEIDTIIGKWKEETAQKYGKEEADKCGIVCVDWLDKVDTRSLRREMKNAREDQFSEKLSQGLSDLTKKYNVALWSATQGTRSAIRKDKLDMGDTAQAFHKNDALDIGVGLSCLSVEDNAAQRGASTAVKSDDSIKQPENKRILSWSLTKMRRGLVGISREFYQGPTLKFWDSKSKSINAEEQIANGGYDRLIGFV